MPTPNATSAGPASPISYIAQGAIAAAQLIQTRDGRAGFNASTTQAYATGASTPFTTTGIVVCPWDSTASVQALDGMPAYWDRTNGYITWRRLGANRGFLAGTFVGDVASGATSCSVNLNVPPVYDLDLARMPFSTVIVKTAGAPALNFRGGALDLILDSTNEAQKVDALGSTDQVVTASKAIVRLLVNVVNDGAGGSQKFYLGLFPSTHATDPTTLAQYFALELDGNSTKINALSKDPSTTVAKTDTTKTFTAGTRFEVWLDTRTPASMGVYVNAVRVLPGTVFSWAAGASNLFLLAYLVKTAAVDVMEVQVDAAQVITAEQSTVAA